MVTENENPHEIIIHLVITCIIRATILQPYSFLFLISTMPGCHLIGGSIQQVQLSFALQLEETGNGSALAGNITSDFVMH